VRNPFKPTAGAAPPQLVGREDVLAEIDESIDDGPGAPARLAVLVGPRGTGKTVLLGAIADRVAERGWLTVAETAAPGLGDRLRRLVERRAARLDTAPTRRSLSGVTLPQVLGTGGGGLQFAPTASPAPDLRATLEDVLDDLESRGVGLLISVDEIHSAGRDDLRILATAFQHLMREGRDVALVLAGLPSSISDLLNDDVLTFLRRATPFPISAVAVPEVRSALAATFATAGKHVDAAALDEMALASEGYPFMIQLVGYHAWRAAPGAIDVDTAMRGIAAARGRLAATVLDPALADCSRVDREFLHAMAGSATPVRTSTVAARLGVSPGYANVYRTRLIAAGLLRPSGYGEIDFALPALAEHLRATLRILHAAT
jgi:hypothetical protein